MYTTQTPTAPIPAPFPGTSTLDPAWAVVRVWLPGKEGVPSKVSTALREDVDGAGVGHVSLELPWRYWSWWPLDEMNVTMLQSVVGVTGKHHTLIEDEEFERDYDMTAKKFVEGARPREADLVFVMRTLDPVRMAGRWQRLTPMHASGTWPSAHAPQLSPKLCERDVLVVQLSSLTYSTRALRECLAPYRRMLWPALFGSFPRAAKSQLIFLTRQSLSIDYWPHFLHVLLD